MLYNLNIGAREGSQWVLNWAEGFLGILMGPSIIEMVIKGSEKIKLAFRVVLMVQKIV